MSHMNWIDQMITDGKYPSFKKAYALAVSEGEHTFTFEGQDVITDYAKYVVMYVDGRGEVRT